jgi:hypothetical protein
MHLRIELQVHLRSGKDNSKANDAPLNFIPNPFDPLLMQLERQMMRLRISLQTHLIELLMHLKVQLMCLQIELQVNWWCFQCNSKAIDQSSN